MKIRTPAFLGLTNALTLRWMYFAASSHTSGKILLSTVHALTNIWTPVFFAPEYVASPAMSKLRAFGTTSLRTQELASSGFDVNSSVSWDSPASNTLTADAIFGVVRELETVLSGDGSCRAPLSRCFRFVPIGKLN